MIVAALTFAMSSPAMRPLAPSHRFEVRDGQFQLDGKPYVVRSGEMHYPRVPRAYWRARFRMARAMGLNTITTYVFWNLHEPTPGKWDFSGNLDLGAYLKIAKEEGLNIILRPGPYICTETDFGGFPAWLMKDPTTVVRSTDPKYLGPAGKYLRKVAEIARPYLAKNGGPIILTQVENEYGSFGADHVYMAWVRDTLRSAGMTGQLYTADGPGEDMLKGGTLPDLPIALNFGGGAEGSFPILDKFRPGSAKMIGEYWCGWFDHWGETHHRTSAQSHLGDIEWCLKNNVSFSLYMFHGGTCFGFMPGANGSERDYQPDTTSYDYDSPLDEAGRVTPKYRAFRAAIQNSQSAPLPPVPPSPVMRPIVSFTLRHEGSLLGRLNRSSSATEPKSFEQLGQAHGSILYRTHVNESGNLDLGKFGDYATVFVDGKKVAELDRRLGQHAAAIQVPKGGARLDLLLTYHARINFGRAFIHEREGLRGNVLLNGQPLKNWTFYQFPLETPPAGMAHASGPQVYHGFFKTAKPADTFLDVRAWHRGLVWVNGHNLGRFWNVGPQQSLFLPAPWQRRGKNEVVVLEESGDVVKPVLSGVTDPIFESKKDWSKLHRRANQTVRFGSGPAVAGELSKSADWQTIRFEKPTRGRFVGLEVDSEHNGGPYASLAELEALDPSGKLIDRKNWKIAYADSEEISSEDGSAANVLDGNADSIWHSEWSADQPGMPHRLVLDLGTSTELSGLRLLGRPSGVNGRIRAYKVYVSDRPFAGQ